MTAVSAICISAVIIYLIVFDPTEVPAPRCMFKLITSLECPGCGTQRAIHALFHGHIAQAWNFNPALFFAVPLIALYIKSPQKINRTIHSARFIYCLVGIIILYWIIRNL